MTSLYSIPDHVLTDIFILALQPEDAAGSRWPDTALPLLLCSKHINELVSDILPVQKTVTLSNTKQLRDFVSGDRRYRCKISAMHGLCLTLYSSDNYNTFEVTNVQSEEAVEETAALMKKLPVGLLSLQLLQPRYSTPTYISTERSHPRLLEGLRRFADLRDLTITSPDNYFHLDMFTHQRQRHGWGYTSISGDIWVDKWDGSLLPEELAPPLAMPMFPALRRLSLQGSISADLTAEQVSEAFSDTNLPRLRELRIDGLSFDSDFVPQCFATMHPLESFEWMGSSSHVPPYRDNQREPGWPPGQKWLELLSKRHGATLQTLVLFCDGWDVVRDDEDHDFTHVESFPRLENALIETGEPRRLTATGLYRGKCFRERKIVDEGR